VLEELQGGQPPAWGQRPPLRGGCLIRDVHRSVVWRRLRPLTPFWSIMAEPSLLRALVSLALGAMLLSSCVHPSPAMGAWEDTQRAAPITCDAPSADQYVVLACDEGECSVFDIEDVDPEAVADASLGTHVELTRGFHPPFRAPGPHRNCSLHNPRQGDVVA
jgi:hypothetical protein